MCPVLPEFLPPAANCKAAGTARGTDRRQGESTAHAGCHFFLGLFMQVIGTFTGELSPLIIHCHLDVSKKSCTFLRAMSPSNLANVFSFLNSFVYV